MKNVNHSPALVDAIDQLLSEAPTGLTEYGLMQALDEQFPDIFPKPNFSEKILMFQHHFMLRHCLYRLQNDYAQHQDYRIDISLVTLVKRPARPAEQGVIRHDPLREYYLELANMNNESEASIEGMLSAFWTRLTSSFAAPEAHKILGLKGNETQQQKQHRYRQLAQQHHPDKGGDAVTFNKIQQAWRSIRKP